ncbi:MAG: tpiA [Haloplasmataceae bacterium]|jgi:triosephosphate isomerase|nr:tpiA [Haloplasmataceae bacterium]
MRKPIIAGNWKMYKTRDEALQFIYTVNQAVPSIDEVETVICAPAVLLRCLVKRQGDHLKIGAQNMHFEEKGAYTGEVSPFLLKDTGVQYVIIGHSERREMFNETDESVNKKVHAAFKYDLTPIVCVGEKLQERENGTTNVIVDAQTVKALSGLTKEQVKKVVVAYEPIWAIGTGRTATAEIANETCGYIRSVIERVYGKEVADEVRVQYGGSVKPNNIKELMAQEHIDGALIGGASLEAEAFITMTNFNK